MMASNYNNWLISWPNPYPKTADYIPKENVIIDITNSNPVVITTFVPHGYHDGNIIRILVPLGYGITELNNQYALAIVLTDNTFSMPIDTTSYMPFTAPAIVNQYAQCIPIAEINETVINATFNDL